MTDQKNIRKDDYLAPEVSSDILDTIICDGSVNLDDFTDENLPWD